MGVLQELDAPIDARGIEETVKSGKQGFWKSLKYLIPRAWTAPPYDLRGGHIFNPGASPGHAQAYMAVAAGWFAAAAAGATAGAGFYAAAAGIFGGNRVADACGHL